MSDKSAIEWTDATWNPVTGCNRVSPGCAHCYAETFAERWRGVKGHHFEQGFDVKLWPERLDVPLKWKRPRRIFVNSMSDLFHEKVPSAFIRGVFAVMAAARQHTFQILTKRAHRMATLLDAWNVEGLTLRSGYGAVLPNVWLGVSVENQRAANERIPLLCQIPAAMRFLSCEPLLGAVDLNKIEINDHAEMSALHSRFKYNPNPIDWVICGGESGHGARPMDEAWARALRDQCQAVGVPFFMKQLGGARDKRGDLEALPVDLRVRQFPGATL